MQGFEVPQQLGEGAASISPSYYRVYLSVGMLIGRIEKK
jgi:hypothetical protein